MGGVSPGWRPGFAAAPRGRRQPWVASGFAAAPRGRCQPWVASELSRRPPREASALGRLVELQVVALRVLEGRDPAPGVFGDLAGKGDAQRLQPLLGLVE